MKIIVKDIYEIKNRGTVWVINLGENGISPYRKDINLLMNITVTSDQYPGKYKIKGIELFATPDTYQHTSAGLLVIPEAETM